MFTVARPAVSTDELRGLLRELRAWGRALAIAEREGAVPTLWRALKPLAAELPEQARRFLQARSAMQDFRMARLAARSADAIRELQAHAVPVLLLKGAAIGAHRDPSFRARPMTDVDLLVRRNDLPAARAALAAAGWTQTQDAQLHSLLEGMQHEAPFLDAQLAGVRLELHTALLPPDHSFDFDPDALWERSLPAAAPFAGAHLPSPEMLVLHAAIHFAWQHQMAFGAWRTLRGIALLVDRPEFDWTSLVAEARTRRAASALHWTLRLGRRLGAFDAVAPATADALTSALAATRPPTPELLAAGVERHVIAGIAPGEFPASPSQRVSRWLWLAAIRPGWSGHARAGRYDPEERWERARGTASTESQMQKLTRHGTSYRMWLRFLAHTLFGR